MIFKTGDQIKRYTISDMKRLAKNKKGRCISNEYLGIDVHLSWKCSCGNVFSATPTKVIHRQQWCPVCGIKKRSISQASNIEECKKIALKKNGKCLSNKYVNNSTLLKWKCNKDHIWSATLRSVKGSKNRKGTWCPTCSGNLPHDLKYAHMVAADLNWKCLSKSYINYNSKMDWKCSEGHEFSQSLAKVVSRKRCPKCRYYYGEELCRFYFEAIFKSNFPKSKPKFLKVSKGVIRELDGYNEELGIAFEHHGEQHYKFNSRFHKSVKDFRLRQREDQTKRKICKRNGIVLIEIPAIPEILSINDVEVKVTRELKRFGIKFNKLNIPKLSDFNYLSSNSPLHKLQDFAKSKGGKLVSKMYVNSGSPLKWKCKIGHYFFATAENVLGNQSKPGTWCRVCAIEERARKQRYTIVQMQEKAKENGGICLSSKYVNALTKLNWKCGLGHVWSATPASIFAGSWCPECAGKNVTVTKLQKWAQEYSGKCLSSNYANNTHKMKWSCKNAHVWNMSLSKMQRRIKESKVWCIECKKVKRPKIK